MLAPTVSLREPAPPVFASLAGEDKEGVLLTPREARGGGGAKRSGAERSDGGGQRRRSDSLQLTFSKTLYADRVANIPQPTSFLRIARNWIAIAIKSQ